MFLIMFFFLFQMLKILVFCLVVVSALSAEILTHATLDKEVRFKPEGEEAIETHAIYKKQSNPEPKHHPVYRAEEHQNEGRAKIEPVRPRDPVINHDMLADEPVPVSTSEVNRNVSTIRIIFFY